MGIGKLCFDKDSFQKSSMVLAQLMLAENENYGNNASGQFLQLFHVMLPGTEASLTQRIDLLKTLYGRGGEYLSIVLQALNSAFASHSFSRTGSAAHFGLEENRIMSQHVKRFGIIGMHVETWSSKC